MAVWEEFWGAKKQSALALPRLLFNKLFSLRVARHARGGRMLEVGSGTSTCMTLLRECGYTCVGVDRSKLAVRQASKAGHPLVRADALSLPFKDESFDMAYTQGLLEHFTDTEIRKIVSEMRRVAKRIAFTFPPKRGLFEFAEKSCDVLGIEYVYPEARYFSKSDIKDLLQGVFSMLRIECFLLIYIVIAE